MREESWEKVARRWASSGEAAIRRSGGAETRVLLLLLPVRVGEWPVVAEVGERFAGKGQRLA
jgi:hypothetical protein